MTRRSRIALSLGLAFLVIVTMVGQTHISSSRASAATSRSVLNNPYNPDQFTPLVFGDRSFWFQPWRSALTTQPGTLLENAVGVNFNMGNANDSEATAQLLQDEGFKRARVEIGWGSFSYDDPTQWRADNYSRTVAETEITALKDHGIRPLILLNANSGGPVPYEGTSVTLAADAAAGATTITLTPDSIANVIPDHTALANEYTPGGYPDMGGDFIENVDSGTGVATLSRPLPTALSAGGEPAVNMLYPPFSPPLLADGTANPRFQTTMNGWLIYVKTVTNFVKNILGNDQFDIEVWNELTFGSDYLDERNYYSNAEIPDPNAYETDSSGQLQPANTTQAGSIYYAITKGTSDWIADPANGMTDVQVGDGFDNQWPWGSPATEAPNMTAIDHHPYAGLIKFPANYTGPGATFPDGDGNIPLDAQGNPDYTPVTNPDGSSGYVDKFVPSFTSFFPEYPLNAEQTETMMRDLTPLTTQCNSQGWGAACIYGTPHGANVLNPGGHLMQNWITEDNLDANTAQAQGVSGAGVADFQAKAALRFYAAYAGEGVTNIDLFAAQDNSGDLDLIPPSFYSAVDANQAANPGSSGFPGDAAGGLTMQAVGRMTSLFANSQPISSPRQLTLTQIATQDPGIQFAGDGTTTHPDLTNLESLAFFPFETAPNHFVAAVYVMTRNLAQQYTSTPAPGQTPWDMPQQNYQLTIGNLNGRDASVSVTDPLMGTSVPATIVSRTNTSVVVQLPVTDSPRMLSIDDSPSGLTMDSAGGLHPYGRGDVPTTGAATLSPATGMTVRSDLAGGYTLDSTGGVHPFGGAPPVSVPSWNSTRAAASGIALRPDNQSGYVVDSKGGIHAFGGAPSETPSPGWPGGPYARGIAVNPCDTSGDSGYTLDGFGGLHPFGGAPALNTSATWATDTARGVVLNTCDNGVVTGYVVDDHGGINPVWQTGTTQPAKPTTTWSSTTDQARGITLYADGEGYVLDEFGSLHPFGGAPPVTPSATWPTDKARAVW